MKKYLEPADGGLGGNIERPTKSKPMPETVEQPTDAGVIIERSLGQIKTEKEELERQIKKLSKLVESPSDVEALENLQNRADRLAAEYADKIANLNDEGNEVTQAGAPTDNEMGEIDDAMITENQPAEPKQSAFQERIKKRVAAWKAGLKPVKTTEQKGQFQHFFDEAAGKQPATQAVETAQTTEVAGEELGKKIEAIARAHGQEGLFLTPKEQDEEKEVEKNRMQELLNKVKITRSGEAVPLAQIIDMEKIKELRRKNKEYNYLVADRLLALDLSSPTFKRLSDIANRAEAAQTAKLHTEFVGEQKNFSDSQDRPLTPEEKITAKNEEKRLRRVLERRALDLDLTPYEKSVAEALRAYDDYVTEYDSEAALPARSSLEYAARLNDNQKKIARDLLLSYQRHCTEQENKKRPKINLTKFVADNPAFKTKPGEDREAVNNLRLFFDLGEEPATVKIAKPISETRSALPKKNSRQAA